MIFDDLFLISTETSSFGKLLCTFSLHSPFEGTSIKMTRGFFDLTLIRFFFVKCESAQGAGRYDFPRKLPDNKTLCPI